MGTSNRFNIYTIISTLLILFTMGCSKAPKESLSKGFVYLTDTDPSIIESVRYSTNDNFLGRVVPGYSTNKIVCTAEAAKALKLVHDDLKKQNYTLVVYDAYRPQRAVDSFVKWADDLNDVAAKKRYYPTIDKKDLFKLEYIADKSSHTRGSTFDLTIIKTGSSLQAPQLKNRKLNNGEEVPFLDDNTVDMGSSFDLFHPVSNHDSSLINEEQTKMRNLLRETMKKNGFKEYQQEWWHYTLVNEPYPNIYYNFVVT